MNPTLSAYLDIIRLGAAIVVFLDHASYSQISGGFLWRFQSIGQEAVLAFFVLSGLVIGYTVNSRNDNLRTFAISRTARIYSVVIPALILTFSLDFIRHSLSPSWHPLFAEPLPGSEWSELLNAMLFTNEIWSQHTQIGSNGAYWSLGFEVWYYVALGYPFNRSWGFASTVGPAKVAPSWADVRGVSAALVEQPLGSGS